VSLEAFIFASFVTLGSFVFTYVFNLQPLKDNLAFSILMFLFLYAGAAVTGAFKIKEN
jgi:hypothetical protein